MYRATEWINGNTNKDTKQKCHAPETLVSNKARKKPKQTDPTRQSHSSDRNKPNKKAIVPYPENHLAVTGTIQYKPALPPGSRSRDKHSQTQIQPNLPYPTMTE